MPVGDSDASVGRWRLQVIGLRRPRTTCSPSSPRIFVRWRVAIELPVFQGRVQPLHVVYLPDQICSGKVYYVQVGNCSLGLRGELGRTLLFCGHSRRSELQLQTVWWLLPPPPDPA